MARNAIQFKKGLGEVTFQEKYDTEVKCKAILEAIRWPEGLVRSECDGTKSHRLHSRNLYQCASSHQPASSTAGTIFEHTKLPLSIWRRGMYHLTQSKNGASELELMRRLCVSYNTTWRLKQKLLQVLLERVARTILKDLVEIDDAYIGVEHTGGKVSPSAEVKTPFVAAIQADWQGMPQHMALHKISGFTNEQIEAFAKKKLRPTADVSTDGLACFAAVINQCCSHTVTVNGGVRKSVENPSFKWVNTALGNIKSSLTGTYRHVSSKHFARYLAEFQYRITRRNDLVGMLSLFNYVGLRTPPMPYKLLKLPEAAAKSS